MKSAVKYEPHTAGALLLFKMSYSNAIYILIAKCKDTQYNQYHALILRNKKIERISPNSSLADFKWNPLLSLLQPPTRLARFFLLVPRSTRECLFTS